jgi:hypothetical protein
MPVFDGLLPGEHDNDIQSLLFTTAEWHTLAKLRLHTHSTTLAWLDESTKAFGKSIRRFESYTCSFFDTRELPQDEAVRSRRQKKKKGSTSVLNPSLLAPAPSTVTATPSGSKKKPFNLILIKLHARGDYVKTIKTFGTTDSYSTQPVCILFEYLLLVLIQT